MASPVDDTYSAPSGATVYGGRFAPAEPDALDLVLASLGADWSDNVAQNRYIDIVERRKTDADFGTYYAAEGQSSVTVSSENPWAYSSPVYVPGRRVYYFTGGGHDDWLASEVGRFDLRTLTWTRTDESAKLKLNDNDPTAPLNPSDSAGWKAWRNAAGRYAPLSTHMYGGMVYLPGLDKVHVQGAATYRSGMGGPGGYMFIDAETGQWDESGAHAAGGGGVNCMSVLVPLVYVVDGSLNPTGETRTDCVFRVSYAATPGSRIVDPVAKISQPSVGYFSAAHNADSAGCIVPDPINAGRLAYVADRDDATFAVFPRVDLMRADGAAHSTIQSRAYGNSKPDGFSASSRWIFMGDYIEGCTKIAAFSSSGGLYALDTVDWTWSEQIAGTPVSTFGDGMWRRFEYLPDYDCFGLFDARGANFYVLKRPAEFS